MLPRYTTHKSTRYNHSPSRISITVSRNMGMLRAQSQQLQTIFKHKRGYGKPNFVWKVYARECVDAKTHVLCKHSSPAKSSRIMVYLQKLEGIQRRQYAGSRVRLDYCRSFLYVDGACSTLTRFIILQKWSTADGGG